MSGKRKEKKRKEKKRKEKKRKGVFIPNSQGLSTSWSHLWRRRSRLKLQKESEKRNQQRQKIIHKNETYRLWSLRHHNHNKGSKQHSQHPPQDHPSQTLDHPPTFDHDRAATKVRYAGDGKKEFFTYMVLSFE